MTPQLPTLEARAEIAAAIETRTDRAADHARALATLREATERTLPQQSRQDRRDYAAARDRRKGRSRARPRAGCAPVAWPTPNGTRPEKR